MSSLTNIRSTCRACDSANMFIALDFEKFPIVNEFLFDKNNESELFDTTMMICKDCGLGQIIEELPRERIFNYYTFKSSINKMSNDEAKKYVDMMISNGSVKFGDWVLEIASNDGYLLKHFKNRGINVLGVDPAKNISMYAICDEIPTITDFFGVSLAKEILKLKGYPKLIIANHVMAHGPYIQDFMEGISILCNNQTIVTIENPTIMNILEYNQFESVYHEHYSYLSCNSVSKLAEKFGLALFDLQEIPTQGRTNRYWIGKTNYVKKIVLDKIKEEKDKGLFNELVWNKYFSNLKIELQYFYNKINNLKKQGKIICGYTAPGKAVCLLTLSKVGNKHISSIADDVLEKQNKYLPGSRIPVLSMENMLKDNPTDIIIFSWNIYDDIVDKLRLAGYNGNIWKWDDK